MVAEQMKSNMSFCSKLVLLIAAIFISAGAAGQEISPETLAKRVRRKNLTVKEWNVEQRTSTRWLDHLKVYDDQGRCVEEIEYAQYGQKERIVTTYGENGLVEKEVVYDDRNKVVRVRKYEYNADGTKSKQYNYLPNGRLYSIKTYEYAFAD